MTFSEQLNEYLSVLNCSAKELSQISGLSNSVISRYRSGERVPRPESEKLNQLCEGIYLLSKEKAASKRTSASITPFSKDEIYTAFTNTLKQPDNSQLCENFNHLLLASSVSLADLARFLNYDSSYLSRIRSGSRIPSDPEWFCSETARFIVLRTPPADRIFIEKLTGQSIKDINDSAALCQLLSGWLLNTNNVSPQINQMQSFLEKLDQFDLNNFIRSIRFDELKVPTMPIQLPGSRSYFGIREFMTAELDYLKTTVLSPSMENVIMYSDMPMEEMSKDPDFPKKWMFGMAMLLKKGTANVFGFDCTVSNITFLRPLLLIIALYIFYCMPFMGFFGKSGNVWNNIMIAFLGIMASRFFFYISKSAMAEKMVKSPFVYTEGAEMFSKAESFFKYFSFFIVVITVAIIILNMTTNDVDITKIFS